MKVIIRKVLNRIENYIKFDTFIILEAIINDQIKLDGGKVEKITSSENIETIYINAGRKNSSLKNTIESRIRRGLDFYTYSIANEIVAFTWILNNVPRFIDEIGISIGPVPKSLWIRDIFVLENQRGRNVFSKFLSLIVSEFYKGQVELIISDILQSNQPSFQAHIKYGFKPIYNIKFSILLNRLLIRFLPETEIKTFVYKKGQSLIKIDDSFKQYVKKNMA